MRSLELSNTETNETNDSINVKRLPGEIEFTAKYASRFAKKGVLHNEIDFALQRYKRMGGSIGCISGIVEALTLANLTTLSSKPRKEHHA